MKKYLFIVTEIKSANGICCREIMRALQKNGDSVFCITNQLQDLPQDFNYIPVKARLSYRLLNANNKVKVFCGKLLNKIKLFLSFSTWPLISHSYTRRIYKLARLICINNEIDCIIPVYTQIDTLIAAKRIKQEFPDIKYIPYFLDSLSGGYGPKICSRKWVIKRGLCWENKLLPLADKIIMMKSSESHHAKYSINRSYYNKIAFLDLPLYIPKINKTTNKEGFISKKVITFLYIGTIPAHIRSPRYFLELFYAIKDSRFKLIIVGTSTCEEYLQNMAKKDKRIQLMPFVSHEKALQMMGEADILVNLGNNNPKMTPSKIFEYMSFGKPIISTAPIPNEPSVCYLKKYPKSLIIEENLNLEENQAKLLTFLNLIDGIECSMLNEVFYLNTPQAFVDNLNTL